MFWTAFMWGWGVSVGATAGLMLFFVCFWSLEWLVGRSKLKATAQELNAQSIAALKERNELTKATNSYLSMIAVAVRNNDDD